MADIDVVKRGGSRAWIWWVVAAVALVLLFIMMSRGADDTRQRPAGTSVQPTGTTLAA